MRLHFLIGSVLCLILASSFRGECGVGGADEAQPSPIIEDDNSNEKQPPPIINTQSGDDSFSGPAGEIQRLPTRSSYPKDEDNEPRSVSTKNEEIKMNDILQIVLMVLTSLISITTFIVLFVYLKKGKSQFDAAIKGALNDAFYPSSENKMKFVGKIDNIENVVSSNLSSIDTKTNTIKHDISSQKLSVEEIAKSVNSIKNMKIDQKYNDLYDKVKFIYDIINNELNKLRSQSADAEQAIKKYEQLKKEHQSEIEEAVNEERKRCNLDYSEKLKEKTNEHAENIQKISDDINLLLNDTKKLLKNMLDYSRGLKEGGDIVNLSAEVGKLKAQNANLQNDLDTARENLDTAQKDLNTAQEDLSVEQNNRKTDKLRYDKLKDDYEKLKDDWKNKDNEKETLESEKRRIQDELENASEKVKRIESRCKDLEEEDKRKEKLISQNNADKSLLQEQLGEARSCRAELEKKIEEKNRSLEETKEKMDALSRELVNTKEKYEGDMASMEKLRVDKDIVEKLYHETEKKYADLSASIYPVEYTGDRDFDELKAHLDEWIFEKLSGSDVVKNALGLFSQRSIINYETWQQALRNISVGITNVMQAKKQSSEVIENELVLWSKFLMKFSDEKFDFFLQVPNVGASVSLDWMSPKNEKILKVNRVLTWAVGTNQAGIVYNAEVE